MFNNQKVSGLFFFFFFAVIEGEGNLIFTGYLCVPDNVTNCSKYFSFTQSLTQLCAVCGVIPVLRTRKRGLGKVGHVSWVEVRCGRAVQSARLGKGCKFATPRLPRLSSGH